MNFNTQISTSVEQSRRLLALGLKKETADMVWIAELGYDAENHRTYDTGEYFLRPIDYLEGEEHRDNVPAWSLHRLIAMCPFAVEKEYYLVMRRNYVSYEYYDDVLFAFEEYNMYESIVKCIEYLIDCGYINKEYLEE